MNVNTDIFCNMYADDTVIVTKDKESENAVALSNSVLCQIQEWCKVNNIRVNTSKTKHMLV